MASLSRAVPRRAGGAPGGRLAARMRAHAARAAWAAVGLAALAAGLLAVFVARKTRFSRVTLSVPAVVIMIPGVPLYRALTYLNNAQIDDAIAALVTVMFTIVASGMGLALSRMLTDKNWLVEKQERVPNLWEYEEENA